MYQKNYAVTITGATDLLLHKDNIDFGAKVKSWSKDPANKAVSTAGDDRTPAWTWLGCLYIANDRLVIDSDNIMSMLRDGGKKCPAPSGKGTMMRQTQSGILCNEIGWPLMVNGAEILSGPLMELMKESDFEEHERAAAAHGFTLFVKRAKIGTSKHVRVRPRFSNWSAFGTLTVLDKTLTTETLQNVLTFAGAFSGVGDWRPSSPKSPGQFGTFTAIVKEIK